MKFRLTYEGELRPTQRDERGLAPHKHAIRKAFHRQLRQLWRENKFLREHTMSPEARPPRGPAASGGSGFFATKEYQTPKISLSEYVAARHGAFGYRFVPLVRKEWSLICSLHVLFLRRDMPGSILNTGDIDNRIKTLIDALRPPLDQHDLVGEDATPGDDDDPFFCLMEDDNQVGQLTVDTDRLLDPPTGAEADRRKARLVITVKLRPYDVNMFNLSFA